MKLLGRLALAGMALFVTVPVIAWLFGGYLQDPSRQMPLAEPADLPVEPIVLTHEGGDTTAGWFVAANPGRGGVLLTHGIHADRRAMLGRARFLHHFGYSVLLIDLHAHGESSGEAITFGVAEADDARAAMRYLRERLPHKPVAALGASLGGAALLLGRVPLTADALILEGVYPTIEDATRNRIARRLGEWPAQLIAPLLLMQIPLRQRISLSRLRPLGKIAAVDCPLLLIGGERDGCTPPAETRRLFAAAPEPKQLWMVTGAAHEDFYDAAGALYIQTILEFLRRHLRLPGAAALPDTTVHGQSGNR